jgi:polypeptide N-acetylgalactosaminyltransferase
MEIGSLDYMRGVRARLQCKSYSWYLNNVFPEILPSADRLMGAMGSGSLKANGYLRSPASGACIDTLNKKQAGESIGAYPCHYLHGTQALVAAADGTIVVAELTFSSCLTRTKGFAAENASLPVVNGKCEDSEILQKWVTHREDNAAAWIHEKEAEGGSAARLPDDDARQRGGRQEPVHAADRGVRRRQRGPAVGVGDDREPKDGAVGAKGPLGLSLVV